MVYTTGFHGATLGTDRHPEAIWTVADATARLAITGTSTEQLGGVCWQQDDNSFWRLLSISPNVWMHFSGNVSAALLGDGEWLSLIPTTSVTVAENAVGAGAVLAINYTDGLFYPANASDGATAQMDAPGLAVESGTGSKRLLLDGYCRDDSWTWTPGEQLWISTTDGLMTQTAPIGPNYLREVGYAVTAVTVRFKPLDLLLKLV